MDGVTAEWASIPHILGHRTWYCCVTSMMPSLITTSPTFLSPSPPSQASMPSLITLLRGISVHEVKAMQGRLARVWTRYDDP